MESRLAAERSVTELKNIGKVLGRRLAAIGVTTRADLEAMGAPRGYRRLCSLEQQGLPVCYNLYSLQAALDDRDWRSLDDTTKERLRRAAGIED